MTVYNRPNTEWRYEFEVVIPMGDELYLHDSYHTNGFEAEQRALNTGGIIIHDVRVAHKEPIE